MSLFQKKIRDAELIKVLDEVKAVLGVTQEVFENSGSLRKYMMIGIYNLADNPITKLVKKQERISGDNFPATLSNLKSKLLAIAQELETK